MTDFTLQAIYIVLAFMTGIVIVAALVRDRGKPLTPNIVFLAAMLLCWQIELIVYFSSYTPDAIRLLFSVMLPFVAFVALAVFLFVLRFYSMNAYYKPLVIAILCLVPAMTGILAFTGLHHEYLRQNIEIVSLGLSRVVTYGQGFWFWVHAAYCYALIISAFCIALYQYRKVPAIFRSASRLLLVGMGVSIAGNILVVANVFPVLLDFSLVGGSITVWFLYFSTRNHQGLEFLNHAKESIYNEVDEAISILDDRGKIVSRNHRAKSLFDRLQIAPGEKSFAVIEAIARQKAHEYEDADEEGGGTDYYFTSPQGKETVYNLHERQILDNRGRRIATMKICSDVTENRSILRSLESDAGLDAMTGLLNRRRIEQVRQDVDVDACLPIAVISGDLDNLKIINDTQGHQQGDLMLRLAADTLVSSCPPNANIARIGGDEFLIVIPNYSPLQTRELLDIIRTRLVSASVSMSLGYAIKTSREQSLEGVIRRADENMYQAKRNRRK